MIFLALASGGKRLSHFRQATYPSSPKLPGSLREPFCVGALALSSVQCWRVIEQKEGNRHLLLIAVLLFYPLVVTPML